jgi:conjugal transfer pilus assembly protein TraE
MKLNIKGERDKQLRYAFIALSACLYSERGNVLTGSLADISPQLNRHLADKD